MHDLWECINPDLSDEKVQTLEEPEYPSQESKAEEAQYKRKCKQYDLKQQALRQIKSNLIYTITPTAQNDIEGKTEVRDMLRTLAARYKPDTVEEELKVDSKWRQLEAGLPKNKSESAWIQEWTAVYQKGVKLGMSRFTNNDKKGPQIDFLYAVQRTAPHFSSNWLFGIREMKKDISFPELVKKYEEERQHHKPTSSPSYAQF